MRSARECWVSQRLDPTYELRTFHHPPLDRQKAVEIAGLVRLLHLALGAAAAEERIEFSARETFVGLLDRLVHGRERGARGGGDAVAELCEVALLERKLGKAVGRREGHERRRQPLADDAHLLGVAAVDEQHVGAGYFKRLGAAQ